jgi:signal transduction histidine kinase
MGESYSDREAPAAPNGAAVSEPSPGHTLARTLLAQLLPGADADLLLVGLLAEAAAPPRDPALPPLTEAELDAPARELRRVRAQIALAESARMVQHALNNPLTALLAEAQLLELEPLGTEARASAARLVDLARRVAAAARRLDVSGAPRLG